MPFNPTDELTLRFSVTEVNQILGQLQEGPWRIVAPLITKINVQAAQQEQRGEMEVPPPPTGPPAPEGRPYTAEEISQANGQWRGDIIVKTP
jgi:hypothetical protein